MTSADHAGVIAEFAAMTARLDARPQARNLGAFLTEKARALGDQPAFEFVQDGPSLTYRDLADQANRLASSLLRLGVRKGTHVGVMLPNLPASPITFFALARLGAVMVPINSRYTPREVLHVLDDADTQFLIVDGAFAPVIHGIEELPPLLAAGAVILHGDSETGPETGSWLSWDELCDAGEESFEPPSDVGPSDLATILFTSGTTGFPKGCMLSHDYWLVLGQVQAVQAEDLGPRNFLIWQPFFYMGGLMEMMLSMYSDGTAYVVKRMSSSRFLIWLRDYRIHYCYFPLYVMKQHPPSAVDSECQLKFVQAFFYKGEMHHALCERFDVVGFDGYGASEHGMSIILPPSARHMIGKGSIGVPAPYREVKIVDEGGAEVPRGEVGELWVAGRGIVLGYYKRPRANAESFSGKWFRTGDLIRQDADGYYYFVGRLKEMIKRSGENVSAREVEVVLLGLPDVIRAAAVPIPDDLRGEEVKAYVQLADGRGPADTPPDQIFEHCRQHLASFKVPRYLAYIEAFPLNDSGRVRKSALFDSSGGDMRMDAFDRVDGIWR